MLQLVGGKMKRLITITLIFLAPLAMGQTTRNDKSKDQTTPTRRIATIPPARPQPRWLLDKPTAWMLPRGSFDVDFRTFPNGGLQASLNIGLARRFTVGIAYGGAGILSENIPEWNPRIEFLFRYLLVETDERFPSLAIGYSSLGYGLFVKKDTLAGYYEDRYLTKSPGFYVILSKNYEIYNGDASFHVGGNYSLENQQDSDPNIFFGADVGLGYDMVYLAEYDFAFNDNKRSGIFGLGRGYLNMALSWYITPELSLEIDFRDLLLNRKKGMGKGNAVIDREIRLVYLQYFAD
jgi:hypothetical protein